MFSSKNLFEVVLVHSLSSGYSVPYIHQCLIQVSTRALLQPGVMVLLSDSVVSTQRWCSRLEPGSNSFFRGITADLRIIPKVLNTLSSVPVFILPAQTTCDVKAPQDAVPNNANNIR